MWENGQFATCNWKIQPSVGLVGACRKAEDRPQVEGDQAREFVNAELPKGTKPKGPRPKRAQDVINATSAKLRAQRAARVAAVLPLVDEARANGCQLLSVWIGAESGRHL